MTRPTDYDRRKPAPSNMLIEATDWYDYTKDYHLKVWEDAPCEDCEYEDATPRTVENPGVTVAFVEDGTDIIRDMMWLNPDQCEALGRALLAEESQVTSCSLSVVGDSVKRAADELQEALDKVGE